MPNGSNRCGGAYDGCTDFERPKYGVLNVHNDYRGVVRAKQYGRLDMQYQDINRRHVCPQFTFTFQQMFEQMAQSLFWFGKGVSRLC